jgi:N-acetylglucosamine-6-sulfatase
MTRVSQAHVGWLFLALVGCSSSEHGGAGPPPPAARPNIVLILTDDEDVAIHAFLPKTKALLHDHGTTLSNFFVTYSLCCPSRASILRGQYPHNTLIEGNSLPAGGYKRFVNLGLEQATIATWLQQAGYRTVFAGRYLNGYGNTGLALVPPGWSEWYGGMGNLPYNGYDYSLNENGILVHYGNAPADFLTDVIAAKAVAAIHQAAHDTVPFFLYLSPFSPHAPAVAAPRHEGLFVGTPLPTPPNFNEADVSDKPLPIQARPLFRPAALTAMTTMYQKRLRALQSIDDLVESVVGALAAENLLGNTWIFYTSDNGIHLGEHRGRGGKNLPYEEDLRVPFVVRGPGAPAGRVVDAIGLNIDLAPTFADIAGVQPTITVDGRSLVPLLTGGSTAGWRQSFEAERGSADTTSIAGRSSAGAGQVEPGDAAEAYPGMGWNAVRTAHWKYVEWDDGERELYDLAVDPWELTNLFSTGDTALVPGLAAQLHALMTCAGTGCWAVEDQAGP